MPGACLPAHKLPVRKPVPLNHRSPPAGYPLTQTIDMMNQWLSGLEQTYNMHVCLRDPANDHETMSKAGVYSAQGGCCG